MIYLIIFIGLSTGFCLGFILFAILAMSQASDEVEYQLNRKPLPRDQDSYYILGQ